MNDNIIFVPMLIFNLISFVMFGLDKRLAVKGHWRIREKDLLLASLFGGFGAGLGMWLFHHKTRKPKFYITVPVFGVLNMAAIWAAVL
ncbi:MAG: DUF1294 domain-containing protein [Oscillospiraceae bacterium]